MKKAIVLLSLLVLALVHADTTKVYKDLSLQDAIKIAKKQNLEIEIAKFDEDVAKLGLKVARGYSFGKLDATLMGLRSNDAGNVFGFKLQSREATFRDFGFSDFLSGVGGAIGQSDGDFATFAKMMGDPQMAKQLLSLAPKDLNYPKARTHFDTKFTFMIPIYTGWKLKSYRDIARKMVDMAKYDREKVVAEKLFQIQKAYYDISLLDNFKKDLLKIKINMQELENTTREMRKEGYAKKSDLLEIKSKLANINRMVKQTEANLELSYEFLSFLLNAEVKSIRHVPLDAPNYRISLKEALQRNLDVKKAKKGLEIQEKMVDIAKSAFHPTIGAFAEYGSADDKIFNEFKDHDRYTYGVRLSYNLFNGGSDYAKVEQEKLKRLKVLKQVELAKKGIALKFKKIQTQIKNLDAQVESLQAEVELSKEIFNTYLAQYEEGLASINDVMIKEALQLEKLLKLQQAQTQRNEKILELAKLTYGEIE